MTPLDNSKTARRIDLEQEFLNLGTIIIWDQKFFSEGTVLYIEGCLAVCWFLLLRFFYSLGACDNQKCLQTLLDVHWGSAGWHKITLVEKHCLKLMLYLYLSIYLSSIYLSIYLEKESTSRGGAEGEERENPKQALCCWHRT